MKGAIQQNRAILSEARAYIFLSLFLFLAGAVIGFYWPARFEGLLAAIEQLATRLQESSTPGIIATIFLQNASSAFLAIWLGLILGLLPLVGAVTNGILLGMILAVTGGGLPAVLSLIPHGIFELPAIFIAWGVGIWRGMWLFQPERKTAYKDRARKAYFIFLTLILPLLIIAAVIEGLGIAFLRG